MCEVEGLQYTLPQTDVNPPQRGPTKATGSTFGSVFVQQPLIKPNSFGGEHCLYLDV